MWSGSNLTKNSIKLSKIDWERTDRARQIWTLMFRSSWPLFIREKDLITMNYIEINKDYQKGRNLHTNSLHYLLNGYEKYLFFLLKGSFGSKLKLVII